MLFLLFRFVLTIVWISSAAFYTSQILTGGKVYHPISFLLMSALNIVFVKKQKKQKQKSDYYLVYNFTFCCKRLKL